MILEIRQFKIKVKGLLHRLETMTSGTITIHAWANKILACLSQMSTLQNIWFDSVHSLYIVFNLHNLQSIIGESTHLVCIQKLSNDRNVMALYLIWPILYLISRCDNVDLHLPYNSIEDHIQLHNSLGVLPDLKEGLKISLTITKPWFCYAHMQPSDPNTRIQAQR